MVNKISINGYFCLILLFISFEATSQSYITTGIYKIPENSGFNYAADRSFGGNYVYENGDISVYLIKEPLPPGKTTRNSQLYEWMINFYHAGFYQEKGKTSSYRLKFLDNKKGYFTRFGRPKNLNSKEKVYLLFYSSKKHFYRIIIFANTGKKHPPKEAREFVEAVRLKD